MHTVNYHYYCHFPGLELCSYLKAYGACTLKDKEMVEFSKQSSSWKIILETSGNVVKSEVDTIM